MHPLDPAPRRGQLWFAQNWTSIPGRVVEVVDLSPTHVWFMGPGGLVRATRKGFCADFAHYL